MAALSILETALSASEAALIASYIELYNGALDDLPRGSSVRRANSVIIHARRLAAVLDSYRDALDRDARREQRVQNSTNF